MDTILDEISRRVSQGARFRVDLINKSLRIGDEYLVTCGVHSLPLGVESMSQDECISQIEGYYARYRHSIPSERADNKRARYFRALPENELDGDDMLYGEPREVAQARLETFVLCSVLMGNLSWDSSWGSWFWQSEKHPSLILLRQWVEGVSGE